MGRSACCSPSCLRSSGQQLVWMSISSYIYYLAASTNLLAAGEFSWSWSSVFSALSEFGGRSALTEPLANSPSLSIRSDPCTGHFHCQSAMEPAVVRGGVQGMLRRRQGPRRLRARVIERCQRHTLSGQRKRRQLTERDFATGSKCAAPQPAARESSARRDEDRMDAKLCSRGSAGIRAHPRG